MGSLVIQRCCGVFMDDRVASMKLATRRRCRIFESVVRGARPRESVPRGGGGGVFPLRGWLQCVVEHVERANEDMRVTPPVCPRI